MAEKLNFEQSMSRLEEIAQKLESGQVDLDEAMELYAQAAKHIAFCQKKLAAAKLKIEKIDLKTAPQPTEKEEENNVGV